MQLRRVATAFLLVLAACGGGADARQPTVSVERSCQQAKARTDAGRDLTLAQRRAHVARLPDGDYRDAYADYTEALEAGAGDRARELADRLVTMCLSRGVRIG